MGIPVNALTHDELLHYAGLDPDAAAELTRRITVDRIDPNAERDELLEDVHMLEGQVSDAEDAADYLREYAMEACGWIRRALDPDDNELTLKQFLQKALDRLE